MGKPIIPQRRGKGGLVYRSPSHRHLGDIRLVPDGEYKVEDIIHAPGRNAPLLLMSGNDGSSYLQIAVNGSFVGQKILSGSSAPVEKGNTLSLGQIPDGTYVHNIESKPGDGGKFCRTGGSSALVVSHGENVVLKLPSGKMRNFHPSCRATVGFVAGSGSKDIPVLKAGRNVHYLRSKAKRPYTVRGVAMNAVNHPHGGGNHQHIGRPSTVGRGTPPGRKVGRLSPKRRKS
ncbi:MAG TPA: 50S ribosomal protein L2 [Thermoplasmataceae archaeon]|nr:50S ribosomal protein L2 [Thermoplasmatales archaeon AK]HLH85995.1 50S ribosomal protein L2 [Thermoplasmataceae archaeon]